MKHDSWAWLFPCAIAALLSVAAARPASADCGPGVTRLGPTWVVSPSGTDDTQRVQCALDAARAAGPGKTVRLTQGTFRVGLVRVEGFVGTFKGAGMDATRITPLLNLACPEEVAAGRWPVLVAFDGGFPRISDLAFEMTADQLDPCLPYTAPWDPIPQTGLGALLIVGGGPITEADADHCDALVPAVGSATVERVRFKGPYPSTPEAQAEQRNRRYLEHAMNVGGWGVYGSTYCADWFRRVIGKFTVTSSVFEDIHGIGTGANGLLKGTMKVGGDPRHANRFKDVGYSILAMGNDLSTFEFSHNDVDTQSLAGVAAFQSAPWWWTPDQPSTVLIHHNRIRARGAADAISLIDFGPPFLGAPPTLNAIVARNTITLDNTVYGGLFGLGVQKATVVGNTIRGDGLAGIYVGISGDSVSGWRILGNNVEGVNAPPAVAPIWLGPGTNQLLVVGGRHSTRVLDEGTDNVLINVDKIEPAP